MIRLALIGFGKWGRNYVKAAEDSGEATVSIVVEDRSQGSFFLSRIMDCDAVVYAGHPSLTAHVVETVLRHQDKPVLCEKPAGLSVADAERIAAAEAKSKAFVLVGHQHLFAPAYEAFRLMAQDETEPVHATWKGPGPVRDYPAWWDYGAHPVALALGILGREVAVDYHPEWDVDDDFLSIKSGDRTVFVAASNRAAQKRADLHLQTSAGVEITYDGYLNPEPPLTTEVRAFARAVASRGTDDWRFGARWAVDVARVLEATNPDR